MVRRTHEQATEDTARFSGSFSAPVPAPADEVFALVTDAARLPEWNCAVRRAALLPVAGSARGGREPELL